MALPFSLDNCSPQKWAQRPLLPPSCPGTLISYPLLPLGQIEWGRGQRQTTSPSAPWGSCLGSLGLSLLADLETQKHPQPSCPYHTWHPAPAEVTLPSWVSHSQSPAAHPQCLILHPLHPAPASQPAHPHHLPSWLPPGRPFVPFPSEFSPSPSSYKVWSKRHHLQEAAFNSSHRQAAVSFPELCKLPCVPQP